MSNLSDHERRMIDTVHAYVRALNDADIDAIVALYAEDASVEDPVGSPPKVGHAAIREFYAGSIAMQLTVTLEGEVRVVGNTCAFPFNVSLTYNGRPTVIRPIDIFEFDDAGHITSMHAYFGPPNISH